MFTSLINLLSLISPVLIFIACCLYLSKRVKPDSILLFIGSGISVILSIFYSVIMPMFMSGGAMNVTFYYEIARVISFIAEILFAIGFFILITNVIRGRINVQNFFPPNTEN
ncbi:hypothetical protein EZJ43_00690 [Pedobacter changchengzhani]|uniref:Uncharacterized protein n=1 Tax=Pedobacter changchengzhani TaxID=2529274 RepID=A0A4R5MQH4_9SPHI|nr:hypothetical protein [Pedobacter changchengzhani]TDG37645.1 hypothetical protein EZJ43_00690 [Pedobacter changchengzhani]